MIVRPIEMIDGEAVVPDPPGLGVELDLNALDKFQLKL